MNAVPHLGAATALDLGVRVLALALIHNAVRSSRPGPTSSRAARSMRGWSGCGPRTRWIAPTAGWWAAGCHPLRLAVPTAAVQIAGALVLLPFPRLWPVLLVLWLAEAVNQPLLRPGLDGGDEMLRVVTVVMFLRALTARGGRPAGRGGLPGVPAVPGLRGFRAVQRAIDHVVVGFGPAWRAVDAVLRHRSRRPPCSTGEPGWRRLLAGTTVLWESLFFVCVLAGPRAALVGLAGALAFHFACGVVMGLDGFTLPFAASFPAPTGLPGRLAGAHSGRGPAAGRRDPGVRRRRVAGPLALRRTGPPPGQHLTQLCRLARQLA